MDGPANKRLRGNNGTIVEYQDDEPQMRTSSLSSPTLQLSGHKGSVYALSYSPSGQTLCSASFDMTCLLWNHGSSNTTEDMIGQELGSYQNFNVLKGHKNAVLD